MFLDNYINAKGGEAIKKLFGTMMSVFDYAKPIELIYDLLVMGIVKNNAIVLDFFAGSGTTGHAVMKFNQDFGQNVRYILTTNNQNNICREITYERLKRAIQQEYYCSSLKYFKVDFIPISNKLYYEYADDLLKHVKELVELENGVNFVNNCSLSILLTENEVEEFIHNKKAVENCKKIYLGHDVLLTGEQESLIEQNKIELNIIPEYYYKDLEA